MDEAAPEDRDRDERRDEAEAEAGVEQQREVQARLPGGDVGEEGGAGRGRDHRRDDRHQPAAERRVGRVVVAGDHQERDERGGREAGERAEQPEGPGDRDGEVDRGQRAGGDDHRGHRRRAEERRHAGAERVVAVAPEIAQDRGGGERGEAGEQRGGVQPRDDRQRVEARDVERELGRRQRDDAGPHDRRVPVGTDAEAVRHASRIGPAGAVYQSDGAAIVSWLETIVSRG